jgi:hypothetical protein
MLRKCLAEVAAIGVLLAYGQTKPLERPQFWSGSTFCGDGLRVFTKGTPNFIWDMRTGHGVESKMLGRDVLYLLSASGQALVESPAPENGGSPSLAVQSVCTGGLIRTLGQTPNRVKRETFDLPAKKRVLLDLIAVSPSGRLAVINEPSGSLGLWDLRATRRLMSLCGAQSYLLDDYVAAISSDEQWVACGEYQSSQHSMVLWNVRTKEKTIRAMHDTVVTAMAFSPDSRSVLTAESPEQIAGGYLRLQNLSTGAASTEAVGLEVPHHLAFSPSGNDVLEIGETGGVHLLLPKSKFQHAWKAFAKNVVHRRVFVSFSPDGRLVMVSVESDAKSLPPSPSQYVAEVWDVRSGQSIARLGVGAGSR